MLCSFITLFFYRFPQLGFALFEKLWQVQKSFGVSDELVSHLCDDITVREVLQPVDCYPEPVRAGQRH